MKEATQANPSIVIQTPDRPPPHKKWKAARMKGDKYINEDVAEVASKIDALEEQSSQGSFTPGTRMDILSTAIGKPDSLDHVRGETRGGSNLLIDDEGILKIADFGLATLYDPEHKQPLSSRVVKLWYRAPELHLGATHYGGGIDLCSAGCILRSLLREANHTWLNRGIACCVDPHVAVCIMNCP
ncbi:hypothetical protein K1719_033320 [Acacia pycnantha]|nr:hypothetical protein K1719_033320 [Acacia pycnantha]